MTKPEWRMCESQVIRHSEFGFRHSDQDTEPRGASMRPCLGLVPAGARAVLRPPSARQVPFAGTSEEAELRGYSDRGHFGGREGPLASPDHSNIPGEW